MKIKNVLLLMGGFLLVHCAHFKKESAEGVSSRKTASVSPNSLVEFPAMGLTVVIKDKSEGVPVAAIFDKHGEFYPEIQSKINKNLKASAMVDFIIVSSQVLPENKIYKESKEQYATLVIQAKTLNGLNKKEQILKFAIPMERMIIKQKGGKAQGLGYWNTVDVRPLDPEQSLPF